jgi:hypothetical protein
MMQVMYIGGKSCTTYRSFCWGNLREREHLEDPGVDWNVILRSTHRKLDGGAWVGLDWLRIWTGGRYL